MSFVKYPSIANTYHESFLKTIRDEVAPDTKWIVNEKIHGCNFMMQQSRSSGLVVGSRNQFLVSSDLPKFYHADYIVDRYSPAMKRLLDVVESAYPDLPISSITVFGELFGGLYRNHPIPMKAVDGKHKGKPCKPIQKQVLYADEIDFMAFDMMVQFEPASEKTPYWLNWDQLNVAVMSAHCEFQVCDAIFSGTLDECLIWSGQHKEDPTLIPAYYGLPLKPNNAREGHVIRPISTLFLSNGSRVILKDKSTGFAEKQFKPNSSGQVNVKDYLTVARLDSVRSKCLPDSISSNSPNGPHGSFNTIRECLAQDIREDVTKDFAFYEWNQKQQTHLYKMIDVFLNKHFVH